MEEEDYSKLSIEDRCVHKVWKARVSGYEAAANLFRQIDDEKSSEWNKYISLIKKFVIDSNAPAQEKGLEATLAFVENCATAGKTVGDVMNGLIQKCVGAPKAKTKDLASQIALMYIEIEKQDVVLEELMKGTENKNPKISASCIHIILLSLQDFGAKVVNVSKILKKLLVLLEDRDKGVRDETKALLVEIFRWVGPSLKGQLTNLKPTQLAEIEVEYEKLKDKQVKPTRLLKSQQMKKVQAVEVGPQDVNSEVDTGVGAVEIDPYEFLDPVDILSQLPKNFYTQLEAKKWSERKEALDILEKSLTAAPKIENADYGELVKTLKKVVQKDSNVVVVGVAIKCITGLASGLKKKFHQYSSAMMPCLFEKFKEKKQNVVLALRDAVDAVYLSTTLELILEDVITYLDNKNPSVKAEIVLFLARSFTKSTPAVLNKKLLKPLTKSLLKTLSDQDQIVRDNAAQALGTAMKVTGEKVISPFLTEVDNQKLAKIKECCEKAEILVRPQKSTAVEIKSADEKTKSSVNKTVVTEKVKQTAKVVRPVKVVSSNVLQREDAYVQATIIPENIRNDLITSGTDKISAYNKLKEFIINHEKTSTLGQIILTFLFSNDVKEVSDNESMPGKLETVKTIIENLSIPEEILSEIIDNVGGCLSQNETKDISSSTLDLLSNIFTLDSVSKSLLNRDFQECPKLWADTLNWISNAIMKNHGTVDCDFLMDCGKKALSQTDALVRNAGLALIGTAHLQVGHESRKKSQPVVSGVVNKQQTTECVKSGIEKSNTDPAICSSSGVNEKDKSPVENVAKVDLSGQITEQLIGELGDKNWKVRAEAVTKIHTMVKNAVNITANLGELPPVLAARITDSNSKIAVASIGLVEALSVAMGVQCKQHTRIFLPALLKLIGDPKVWIRTAVQACLNTWYETGGHKEFFEGETMAEILRTGSPSLRSELWNFLALKLPNIPARVIPKDELIACLPTLYANIEDRNAEVRKNACEAVLGFMIHLGYNQMNSACDNIKGNSGAQVKILLEKTRGSVPEKLPPASKNKLGPPNTQRQSNVVKMTAGSSATITKSVKPRGSIKPGSSYGRKEEDIDTGALLQSNNLKNQRVIDDQKLKTLKWNFTTPRQEFVDLLKELMLTANVNKNLILNMFHNDFRYHLRAIDALIDDLTSNDLSPLTSNLDLILRWMTLRFFDTNPSVLLKGLDYLNRAFSLLITYGYQMLDYEAHSFIPYLILKVGDPKDTVRTSIRALFKQISSMFPVTKLFAFIMEGIKSKNARQRSECLDQLSWLIENYGMIVCQPNPPGAMKEIAKHIADRDTTVRNAALNCFVAAYFLEGEKVLKMVGQLADKDMYLLEERIKRASKNRPVASVKPLQATTPSNDEDLAGGGVEDFEDNDVNEETPYMDLAYTSKNTTSSDDSVLGNERNLGNRTFPIQDEEEQQGSLNRMEDINTLLTNGPFGLDPQIVAQCDASHFNIKLPKINIVKHDFEFLKDPIVKPTFQPLQMNTVTPTLSNYTQKNTLKWEITQITSSDIEKAIISVNQIDTILNSDKRTLLIGFIDLLVNQLIRQLIILNQSSLPDVVTCYRANFALLMKITVYTKMCSEITENTIYKLIDRLIQLLVESRTQGHERHEMFARTINNTILKYMDNGDKTNVVCALINLLYDTVGNASAVDMYKDLVAKCLWKLNRTQPEWDSQLDYNRVLIRVHIFFKNYPSSWWKNQDNDVPLRTVKTILHTMVKVRGMQVQEIAKNIQEISQDCELFIYIKKLVRHLSGSNINDNASGISGKETNSAIGCDNIKIKEKSKLTKENRDQLSEIFLLIGDTIETNEGMKRLFAFQKTNPDADIQPYLAKSTPLFQQYIERGLAALEQQQQLQQQQQQQVEQIPPPQQSIKKKNQLNTSIGSSAIQINKVTSVQQQQQNIKEQKFNNDHQDGNGEKIIPNTARYFRAEAERLWTRLQYLRQKLDLPVDTRSVDELCYKKEMSSTNMNIQKNDEIDNITPTTLDSDLENSFQVIKASFD